MVKFENVTTLDVYAKAKENGRISFEYVPNTAAGCEKRRCFINSWGHKYFVTANTEIDYFASCENCGNSFAVYFRIEGDTISIKEAHYKGRKERSDKLLNKYRQVLTMIASCIKYDRVAVW